MTLRLHRANSFSKTAGLWLRCFLGGALVANMVLTGVAPLAAQIEIRTYRLARVHGLIADRMGKPVGDARVFLVSAADGSTVKEVKTDSLGKFDLGHPDGSYWLQVDAAGFSKGGVHLIVGSDLRSLFHTSSSYLLLKPQGCMDQCWFIYTSRKEFDRAVRQSNGKGE